MNTKNLIEFYIVGKTVKQCDFRLVKLVETKRGWNQVSIKNDKAYDFEYVSKENMTTLMEWFRADFSQYRMFNDYSEAQEYLNYKIS